MLFVNNIYKCVTDTEYAKQFLLQRLPNQLIQALNLTSQVENAIIFTKENITEIVMILIDLLPSLLEGEKIHMGRKLRLVGDLASIFKIDSKKILALLDKHVYKMSAGIEPQGLIFSKTWLTLICTLVLGSIPNPIFLRKLNESMRFFETFERMTSKQQWIETVVEALPKTIQDLIYVRDMDVGKIIEDQIKDITAFISRHREKKTTYYNTAEVKQFKNFRFWIEEQITSLAVDNNAPRNLLTILSKLKNELVDIRGKFIDENFDPHPIEPFCIYISGNPGVGKSSISKYIAQAINNQAERVSEDNLIYVKNPGDPYCTGYTGQFCWIYDDFAQQVGSTDGLDLIKYITPQRAPLNMASMNDPSIGIKGTKQQSLLFICCSNTSHPVFNNLESQDAFLRRRHIVVHMSNDTKDPLQGKFQYLDKFRDIATSQFMNFKDLLIDVIYKYNTHMNNQTTLRQQFVNSMANFSPNSLQNINGRLVIVAEGQEIEINADNIQRYNNIRNALRNNTDIWMQDYSTDLLRMYDNLEARGLLNDIPAEMEIDRFYDSREDNTNITTNELTVALMDNRNYWAKVNDLFRYRMCQLFKGFKQYIMHMDIKNAMLISTVILSVYLRYRTSKKDEIIIEEGSSGHKGKEARHKQWLDERRAKAMMENAKMSKDSKFYEEYEGLYAEGNENVHILNTLTSGISDINVSIHTNGYRDNFNEIKNRVQQYNYKVKSESGNKLIVKCGTTDIIIDNNVKKSFHQAKNNNKFDKNIEVEGCEDKEASDITKLVSNQILGITTMCYSGDYLERTMTMSALPIKGTIIMAPRHLFMYKGKYMSGIIRIKNKNCDLPEVEFDENNIAEIPSEYGISDVVLYNLGSRVRPFRDISNLFCTRDTLALLNRNFDLCLVKQQDGQVYNYITRDTEMITSQVKYDASGCTTVLGKVIQYGICTEKGDCGAVPILFHSSACGKILGMHIAGALHINKGFSKPISREMLKEKITFLEKKFGQMVNGIGTEQIRSMIVTAEGKSVDLEIPIIGLFDTPTFMPEKTKYIKSEAFEICGPHRSEPAILSPHDVRNPYKLSPLLVAVNKYGETNKHIKKYYLDKIRTALPILFRREIEEKHKLYPMTDAINGNEVRYIDSINMKSSPGWPYKKSTEGKKHLFFLDDNGKYQPIDMLRDRLDERQRLGKEGKRISSIWIDSLKDETRPLEKIEQIKTRSFNVAPVDFNIWMRYFTMDFKRKMTENRIHNGISIGINPYSLEWTILANHLTEYSDTGYAGDYAGYDRLEHSELLDLCLEFIYEHIDPKYLTQDDDKFFKTLKEELKFPICNANSYVYIRNRGLPSGADLTAHLNSMVGICYLFYAWLYNAPDKYRNIVAFMNNVKYQVYGDDNIFFPRDSVKYFYNFKSVQKALADIGLTYTPESKVEGKGEEARPIYAMQFLSNGFRPDGDLYKAVLKKISIIEMTNWITNKIPSYAATEDNVNTALRFLYFYGKETFDIFHEKWKKYAKYNYEVLDEIYKTNGAFDDILYFDEEFITDKIESQGNTITHIQNMQGWSHVAKATLPTEITGDKLDISGHLSAMDKPNITLVCPPTVLKDYQGLSNATNVEYMTKLCLNPSCMNEATKDNTAEEEDEMSLKYIARRWGFLAGAFENTTWEINKIILDGYSLEPCASLINANVNSFVVTPLCVATMYNSFWRGGLEYKFIFFTDGFTSGKVCVDFRYGIYDYIAPLKDSVRNSQYSVILDVNPNKYIFHVRVPYMHHMPWLGVRNANAVSENLLQNYRYGVSLGQMVVSVVNPFVGSGADRCKVRLNILERAGEDFEICGSHMNNMTVTIEGLEIIQNQGDEQIIGNLSSTHKPMGHVAESKGTVIDTTGSTTVEPANKFSKVSLSMNPKNIGFEYYFDRWQQLSISTIIENNTANANFDCYSLMWSIEQWRTILNNYVYFRADKMQFRIEINGNPFCSGGLVAAHLPVTSNATKISSIDESNVVNLQHGLLNFNSTSSVTIDAPFIMDSDFVNMKYHKNLINTTGAGEIANIRPFGTLILNYTFARLQTIGTNPQKPHIVFYARIVNPVLKVPIQNVPQVQAQGKEIYDMNMATEMICVGEDYPLPPDVTLFDPIKSFRDLCKKYVPFNFFQNGSDDIFLSEKETIVQKAVFMKSADLDVGYFSLMKNLYGLYRGGYRIKSRLQTVNSETDEQTKVSDTTLKTYVYAMKAKHPVNFWLLTCPDNSSQDVAGTSLLQTYLRYGQSENFASTITLDSTCTTGFVECEIPYLRNCNWSTVAFNPSSTESAIFAIMSNNNNSSVKVNLTNFIAAADDFRMKAFLGVGKAKVIEKLQQPDYYL